MDFDVSSGIVPPRERHRSFTVPSGRLDDIVEGTGIAAAKLDVEGAEVLALAGARRLLASRLPAVWLVEVIATQLRWFGVGVDHLYDVFGAAVTLERHRAGEGLKVGRVPSRRGQDQAGAGWAVCGQGGGARAEGGRAAEDGEIPKSHSAIM